MYENELFKVVSHNGVKFLNLSLLVEWRLSNLNPSFEKVVGIRRRTVMVYSDLVESTVVGSGKFPLLREVQMLRTGDGESTSKPLHHQWIKVRGNQLDILEVEIATTTHWQNPGDHRSQTTIKSHPRCLESQKAHPREPRCAEEVYRGITRPCSRNKKGVA